MSSSESSPTLRKRVRLTRTIAGGIVTEGVAAVRARPERLRGRDRSLARRYCSHQVRRWAGRA
jgi:hypothetical protein